MTTSYSQVPALIPQLKQAAIDAYMVADVGGDSGQIFRIEGNRYVIHSGGAKETAVTRPRNGAGGGDTTSDYSFEFMQIDYFDDFDKIRKRIDKAVGPWLGRLPDPATIGHLTQSMRGAMLTLGLAPGQSEGRVIASGPLGGHLNLISQGLVRMTGKTIEAYKGKFLAQLTRVIANQYAMTVPIGGALVAEQNLWENARQDVANAVQAALDGMNAVIAGAGPNWELVLKVAGWSLKGAGIFATGGLKEATELGELGVEILAETSRSSEEAGLDGQSRKSPETTCEGVLKALEETMNEINDIVGYEEWKLQGNLDTNAKAMDEQRRGYDLTNTPGKEDHPDLGVIDAKDGDVDSDGIVDIDIDNGIARGIIEQHMPNVAKELGLAVNALNGAYETGQFDRPAGLGYGSGVWVNTLILRLVESVKDLQWEVQQGATQLKLALHDINEADRASQQALDSHRKKFDKGSGYEPKYPR